MDTNQQIANSITQIGSAGVAAIGETKATRKQYKRTRKLMNLQFENQQKLNQQQQMAQLQMWKDTNYPAQIEMLKEAGMNPSLLYGKGGIGGATTGSVQGGSASGGHSPQKMDIGNIMQAALMNSTIELTKAQAEKAEAEADSIRGEEGTIGESQINQAEAQVNKIIAETKSEGAKKAILEIQDNIAHMEYQKMRQELERLQRWNMIEEDNVKVLEMGLVAEEVGKILENELTKAKTQLTTEQKDKIWHEIWQGWTNAGVKALDVIVKGVLGKMIGGKIQDKDKAWGKGFQEGVNHNK